MIEDVERYNEEEELGQVQSATGFKMWPHNKKGKSRDLKQLAAPTNSSNSGHLEPIVTALPPPDSDI